MSKLKLTAFTICVRGTSHLEQSKARTRIGTYMESSGQDAGNVRGADKIEPYQQRIIRNEECSRQRDMKRTTRI